MRPRVSWCTSKRSCMCMRLRVREECADALICSRFTRITLLTYSYSLSNLQPIRGVRSTGDGPGRGRNCDGERERGKGMRKKIVVVDMNCSYRHRCSSRRMRTNTHTYTHTHRERERERETRTRLQCNRTMNELSSAYARSK